MIITFRLQLLNVLSTIANVIDIYFKMFLVIEKVSLVWTVQVHLRREMGNTSSNFLWMDGSQRPSYHWSSHQCSSLCEKKFWHGSISRVLELLVYVIWDILQISCIQMIKRVPIEQFIYLIYLFVKVLPHKCWRSVGHQVLQPAKDVEFRTVCLKSCRKEKKSMMYQGSLEPAAIQFTLNSK